MPRTKPVTKLDTIGKLNLRPEEAVGEVLVSKQQDQYFVKPPNWDSAGDSIEQFIIECQREHSAMLILQKELLDHNKRQKVINKTRIRKLAENLVYLRRRLTEVNSFIKDCEEKKQVAEKKIGEQMDFHHEVSEDIAKYKEYITELTEFRKKLNATVSEYEHYEILMEEVVKARPEVFDSVKDCIDRCDALMMAQVEISEMEQQKLQDIENMRAQMMQVTNEAALTVLGLQNDLTQLERAYNQARSECLKWETHLADAKDAVARNELQKDLTLGGIRDIYRLLCRRQNIETEYQRLEVEKELEAIKDEVDLLRDVIQEVEQEREKNDKDYLANRRGGFC